MYAACISPCGDVCPSACSCNRQRRILPVCCDLKLERLPPACALLGTGCKRPHMTEEVQCNAMQRMQVTKALEAKVERLTAEGKGYEVHAEGQVSICWTGRYLALAAVVLTCACLSTILPVSLLHYTSASNGIWTLFVNFFWAFCW